MLACHVLDPSTSAGRNAMQVSDTILRQISKLEDASCWACGAPGSRMQVFMLGKAPLTAARWNTLFSMTHFMQAVAYVAAWDLSLVLLDI